MPDYKNSVGVKVPDILLPNAKVDMKKWAVVACDQFTSQPEYWEETERIAKGVPSTLHLMLPEMYLEKPDEAERIESINAHMQEYVDTGILESKGDGFIYVKRTVDGKTRVGLILALDLENYEYTKGAKTLIRASEGTIVERIPPRLRIRKDAPLELPHILVLIDDPARTVIEPIGYSLEQAQKVYDFELMQDGGHVEGYLINNETQITAALRAFEALADPNAFAQIYGAGQEPMLFAMGDGNHSFATAKANWENCKQTLSAQQRENHPARFALVEIENVHDNGIVFEPIHRVLFNLNVNDTLVRLNDMMRHTNGGCEMMFFADHGDYELAINDAANDGSHILPFVCKNGYGFFRVHEPVAQLEVGTLQNALDELLKELPNATIDYIHGEDVVNELASKDSNLGFLLPPMDKGAFFRTVVYDGALPRKTFSMGEAHEKRYYLECRKITE